MAASRVDSQSIGWDLFFVDLEQLVLDHEQLKASNLSTNISLDETLLERFENAVQALGNVLPHVHHSHSLAAILSEIAHNLQLMHWDYIRHSEFPCRSRCSQVAVLSFNLPETVKTGQPGRPKHYLSHLQSSKPPTVLNFLSLKQDSTLTLLEHNALFCPLRPPYWFSLLLSLFPSVPYHRKF